MRKYISPHYLLSGLLGMLALVLSVSCDDTDVVRRVDPQIEVQADGPRALDLHRAQHALRRRDGIHRTRPRQRVAGTHPQGGPQHSRGIEIDAVKQKVSLKN